MDNYNNNDHLINLIGNYNDVSMQLFKKYHQDQIGQIDQLIKFIKKNPLCFSRENKEGHITGSAFVVNKTFTKALLTYHAKLHKWLQLGGHADGEFIIQKVALKEAQEESGIHSFKFLNILNFPNTVEFNDHFNTLPFDIDIHLIPKRKDEPEHYHFDIRFILIAEHENIKISQESLDLKWIELDEIGNYTSDPSTLRQVNKLKYLSLSHSVYR